MSDYDTKDNDDLHRQFQSFLSNMGRGVPLHGFSMPAGATATPSDPDDEEDEATEEVLHRIREFSLKPKEVRDYLDRFVVRQDEAKKVLSVAICDHYNHVRQCLDNPHLAEQDYAKQNVILLGPTGVGKTYLIRTIAKLIGVPFVKADATKFSETGYVGHDVEDLVRDLVKLANQNLELAQYGIIYIDEIDKIASRNSHGGRDVSGRGVQINLLKLMEDTDVSLHSQTDLIGQMRAMMDMMNNGDKNPRSTINTRHILFIVSGAFDKLAERVRKRVAGSLIGFGQSENEEIDDAEFLKQVETRDFIDYGFEPEFIGRLPVRVVCESLGINELRDVLVQSEGSILAQYKQDFKGYNIKLNVEDEAIQAIAEQAFLEKTGARGLMTVLERSLRDFKFELPSTSIDDLVINREVIEAPKMQLAELLEQKEHLQYEVLGKEVDAFAARFNKEFGIQLEFEKEAVTALVEESLKRDKTIRGLCEEKFKDFHYGLSLISRNTGKTTFTIDAATVSDPDGELSKMVVADFRQAQGAGDGNEQDDK